MEITADDEEKVEGGGDVTIAEAEDGEGTAKI